MADELNVTKLWAYLPGVKHALSKPSLSTVCCLFLVMTRLCIEEGGEEGNDIPQALYSWP